MSERLWIAPYFLTPRARLGARASNGDRYGVLLRVDRGDSDGFADLHPWPELGDPSLAEELKGLRSGQPLALGQRSLSFARRDADARLANKSLFEGLDVPLSHRLVPDLLTTGAADLETWRGEGFTHLKIKIGRNPMDELRVLKALSLPLANFKIRFDFNGIGTVDAVVAWIKALQPCVRDAIEFLEDPIVYDGLNWRRLSQELKIALAFDRGATPEAFSDWLVVKPSQRAAADFVGSSAKICVTSSLDHPLGQLAAALDAAELATKREVGVCGLVSQSAYETTDFSQALRYAGPKLFGPKSDIGFGFTDLLEKVDWRALEK